MSTDSCSKIVDDDAKITIRFSHPAPLAGRQTFDNTIDDILSINYKQLGINKTNLKPSLKPKKPNANFNGPTQTQLTLQNQRFSIKSEHPARTEHNYSVKLSLNN